MKNKLTYFLLFLLICAFGFQHNPIGGWYQQYLPNLHGEPISDITFLDSLTGYSITGEKSPSDTGYILKTTDGGENWIITYRGILDFSKICFINDNIGYVCGGTGSGTARLLKSTNAGINWYITNCPTTAYLEDMAILNNDSIFTADGDPLTGGLFRTINGGVSWQQLYYNFGGNPDKIYMYDGSLGFMGVYPDRLFRTSNGGMNWTLIPRERDFSEMVFMDSLTGWKCDGNIYKTTNSGINWVEQTLPEKGGIILTTSMRSMSVINSDTIWGTGGIAFFGPGRQRGMIYKTTNGGVNWGYQIPDTSIDISQYYFIQFLDSKRGWSYSPSPVKGGVRTIVGGNDTTIYTSVKSISSEVPNNFTLYQNYPNPFNPKTNITYSLKSASYVLIKVFDINGRSVKELVDQRQDPGSYKVNFDGNGLSSGIYFYRIEAGNFVQTKRMVLIK